MRLRRVKRARQVLFRVCNALSADYISADAKIDEQFFAGTFPKGRRKDSITQNCFLKVVPQRWQECHFLMLAPSQCRPWTASAPWLTSKLRALPERDTSRADNADTP